MSVQSVRKLYAYNCWANDRTLASAADLSAEEFVQVFPVSFGSLQATLAHIFGVEWLYLQRWGGNSPPALPASETFPDVKSLYAFWQTTVLAEQTAFLAVLTEMKLQRRYNYVNLEGKTYGYRLTDQMQHMVNHSTYHRGQVVFLLRLLGKKPVSTDFLLFLDQQ